MIKTKEQEHTTRERLPHIIILCCTALFLFCIGATVAPLQRLVGTSLLDGLPTNGLLEAWGGWLPVALHFTGNGQNDQISTAHLEFFLLITLAFVLYGIVALVIRYCLQDTKHTGIFALMWVAAILAGLIFVCTPAMLSHDVFVYADYGHTIVTHGTNLYFVPPAAVSHDALTQLDDWKISIAAYGPLWLDICSLLALLLGSIPWHYLVGFRLLGLAAHLINILLVTGILRKAGCSKRTTLLGAWLYALNPLVLLESGFGAHNDIEMATFLLLGIFLCFRAEQRGFTRPVHYLLPVVAFTLSALIKFTTLPLIFFFLVLLARKTFDATTSWRTVTITTALASLMCGLTLLAFYAPFWVGHTPLEIVRSFSTPPSATYSENSIHRLMLEWVKRHGMPSQHSWAYLPVVIFSSHPVWNGITLVVLGCTVVVGAILLWRIPKVQVLVLAGLASLGALLIVTPWFYSWYVIWLIALAAAAFSLPDNRMRWALVGFALMFSFTAFLTYMSGTIALLGEWASVVQCAAMLGLPVLVFVVVMYVSRIRSGFHHGKVYAGG